jgi:hypothetical protein
MVEPAKPANKPENTIVIAAGNRGIWEVEKSADGTKVTIRYAEKPERNVEITGGAVPELIKALQKLSPYR